MTTSSVALARVPSKIDLTSTLMTYSRILETLVTLVVFTIILPGILVSVMTTALGACLTISEDLEVLGTHFNHFILNSRHIQVSLFS